MGSGVNGEAATKCVGGVVGGGGIVGSGVSGDAATRCGGGGGGIVGSGVRGEAAAPIGAATRTAAKIARLTFFILEVIAFLLRGTELL